MVNFHIEFVTLYQAKHGLGALLYILFKTGGSRFNQHEVTSVLVKQRGNFHV